MKRLLLAILSIFSIFVSASECEPTQIVRFLSKISLEERNLLDYFFRELVLHDSMGYVLLKGKPMSMHTTAQSCQTSASFYFTPEENLNFFFDNFSIPNGLFLKGFKIWKNYESLFCKKNLRFDVIEQNFHVFDQMFHFIKVIIFNKALLASQIGLYQKDQFDVLMSNEYFLGICLGYGKKNASLFQKRQSLLFSLGKLTFTLQQPTPNHRRLLEQEYIDLENKLSPISDSQTKHFSFHLGIQFIADVNDSETQSLQKKYRDLHHLLTQTYADKDFLKATLELISAVDQEDCTTRFYSQKL